MKDTWELHGYGKDLDSRLKKINEGKVSDISNKIYLLDYYDSMLSQGLSIPRITKCLRLIQKADEYFKKDLKTLDEKDVIHYFGWLEQSSYSDWTKNDYKTELKKFLKWIYNDEPPKFVLKIKSGVKNQNKLLPQEVITEQEALKLIECSTSIRNKALISILYESGCRIGEILTLKIKHISALKENFNQVPRPETANLIIYPANIMKFMYTNEKNGIKLANEWQILIDKIRENKIRNF
ncbi:MAG: tyrosine-type recombinase/integrase [Candidatus Nanoarchaeia archaeon]|jgi:integrase